MSLLVADAGPLIGLAKAHLLDLLHRLYSKVYVPQAVFEEVVARGKGRPGATEVSTASWIEVCSPGNPLAHSEGLGKGEAEAIALAKELGADLLVDDRVARSRARQKKISCLTITRLLAMAYKAGLITEVKPVLERLEEEGFGVPQKDRQELLRYTGEEP